MSYTDYRIKPGAYHDSITLMQLQKSLAALPGVIDAGVVMATPANCELLAGSGYDLTQIAARPDDLLVMVKADSAATAAGALAQVDQLLQQRRSSSAVGYRPHSLRGAVGNLPGAQWVLVSVPGRYAAGVAEEALNLGRHVFLYSDNVSLEDEVRLKKQAAAAGLLVMGPDCGTAIINGIGLGFANRVRRGNIGIVAASGTGLQAVSVSIHQRGGGISQAFGTGGRDLKAEVGGITSLQALHWLAADPETAVIVLISKPPAAEVAARLLRAAQACNKPIVVAFLGYAPPARRAGNLSFAAGLDDAAELAVRSLNLPISQSPIPGPQPLTGYLRGLFSGGTLAYEMLLGLEPVLSPLYSNLTVAGRRLAEPSAGHGHMILDLGEDEFTQGRLHPMLDNDLRVRLLRQEIANPDTGLLVIDVVLGDGAHPDPASELAPVVAEATAAGKEVMAVVIGTEDDPQDVVAQIAQLADAGATVCSGVSAALDAIYSRLELADFPFPRVSLARDELVAVNVGLESFYDSVTTQGGRAIQVDWRPPAGGNEQLMRILARMREKEIGD